MDPISQGIVGSSFSQSCAHNKNSLMLISVIGFLSGVAPDIDIFIRAEQDPLLFLEFHRQFTHSLIFIPIGGIICASFFYCFSRIRTNISFKEVPAVSENTVNTIGSPILDGAVVEAKILDQIRDKIKVGLRVEIW